MKDIKDIEMYLANMDSTIQNCFENISNTKQLLHLIKKNIKIDFKNGLFDKEQYFKLKNELSLYSKTKLNELYEKLNLEASLYVEKYEELFKGDQPNKTKRLSPKQFQIIALILVPIMMILGMVLNYILVAPPNFSNKNEVIGFSIAMIIVVTDLIFLQFIVRKSTKRMVIDRENNAFKVASIGFTANFFDVLGVGSFATATGMLKATGCIKNDKTIPGTLNAGMAISNLFTGVLFLGAVNVEMSTLIPFVICAVIGSYIGSKIVSKVIQVFFKFQWQLLWQLLQL